MSEFNLEQSIQEWKSTLWKHQGLEPGHIEELESHLRDKIDDYLEQGLSSESAFNQAKDSSMPEAEIIATDFFKARHNGRKKPPWQRKATIFSRMPMNIKVAVRFMLKQKTHSLINILGLGVGLSACLLIVLYISNELSYDRFYEDADRIYRIANGESGQSTSPRLGIQAKLDFPEIEEIARVKGPSENTLRVNNIKFRETDGFGVDSTFHKIFSVDFLEGNPDEAWTEPNTIVLTKSLADKYFHGSEAYGKLIQVNGVPTKVTGVITDPPQNTHLQYQYLLSFAHTTDVTTGNWIEKWYATYAKLVKGVKPETLEEKFPEFKRKHAGSEIINWLGYDSYDELLAARNTVPTYTLKRMTDLHLYYPRFAFGSGGSIDNVYTFSLVALFILLIACINFMNLCTARSALRLKEVGIRKVLGSVRKQLIVQFLTETVLLSIFAMIISLLLTTLAIDAFSNLANRQFTIQDLFRPEILFSLFGLMLIVGLLAGAYPALFMSRFKPVKALKGELKVKGSNAFLRKGLVVFQFGISIFLIISTVVVFTQLNFMSSKSLGIQTEQVMTIKNAAVLNGKLRAFKELVKQSPNVVSLSYSFGQPFERLAKSRFNLADETDKRTSFTMLNVDEEFWTTYDIQLREGRLFSHDLDRDWGNLIINKTAQNWMGVESIAGAKLGQNNANYDVVGVVEDFHFETLKEDIGPLVIRYSDPVRDTTTAKRWGKSYLGAFDELYSASIRITGEYGDALDHIRECWSEVLPGEPLNYAFVDETFNRLYDEDRRFGKLFTVSSALAVAISCLGLFALTAFTLDRRLKELAVRKVLGASVFKLVRLIILDFTKLVTIGALISIPVGYWLMQEWLSGFAYRIDFSPLLLIIPGVVVLIITWAMVGLQSAKVALTNPVNVLRSE